jgi:hypothetical protein
MVPNLGVLAYDFDSKDFKKDGTYSKSKELDAVYERWRKNNG